MKVIMTGGGTGGHVYPAVAIADEIKARNPDCEILFVGTEHGIENRIVSEALYEIKHITVTGLHRTKLWKNFKTAADLRKGLDEAKKIIQEFKPDIVIGTGGYVCGPVVFTAQKLGIRTYIHEQNAFPGLTNKLLSKKAARVFLAFEEAQAYFKSARAVSTVGNPVRKAFREMSRNEARKILNIPLEAFVILSFGGSLGAIRINDEMKIAIELLRDKKDCLTYFVTGGRFYDDIRESSDSSIENVRYMQYIDNMPLYLTACNVAVTRSGALTVSEIAACGRAAIMIPSPNVTHNHQYFNAKVLADCGASILIEEKNLKEGDVATILETLSEDRDSLLKMEKASFKKGRIDAASMICDKIGI